MRKHGFTIIELMVAMSLFLILVSLAAATFIQTLRTQRLITELTAANDNATQAVEQMAREIRTGFSFYDSTKDVLKFVNYRNQLVSYKLIGNTIVRCEGDCSSDAKFLPITAPEIKINKLEFILMGEELTDDLPTRITIALSVAGPKNIDVNLQTTISTRVLEPEM